MSSHPVSMHFAQIECKRLLHRSALYALCMKSANERLREARIAAQFDNAADAASALNMPYGTYVSHENGHRGFPASRAPQYARKFGVTEEWLLYGKGDGPSGRFIEPEPLISASQIAEVAYRAVDEIAPGMSIGEIKQTLSSSVTDYLNILLADRGLARISDAKLARDRAAPARVPTIESDEEERRSA